MWLSSATLVLLFFFFFPETSVSNILYRRARRLRKATGNSSIMSAPEIALATMSPRDYAIDTLVRPFTLNFQEPIVFALNVYIGLIRPPLHLVRILPSRFHRYLPLERSAPWPIVPLPFCRRVPRPATLLRLPV